MVRHATLMNSTWFEHGLISMLSASVCEPAPLPRSRLRVSPPGLLVNKTWACHGTARPRMTSF